MEQLLQLSWEMNGAFGIKLVEDLGAIEGNQRRYLSAEVYEHTVYNGTASDEGIFINLTSNTLEAGAELTVTHKYRGSDGKEYAQIEGDGSLLFIDASNLQIEKPSDEEIENAKNKNDGVTTDPSSESSYPPITGPRFVQSGTLDAEEDVRITNPIENPDIYKPGEEIGDSTEITNIAITLIRAVRTIGIIFAVIALMIYGIRYMFGSLEERAEYKETMMPWFVGSLLLILGTTIVQYIYTLASSINA